ncbi:MULTISPECIES: DUF2788 domain-containing protein [unclassified Ketobacter]|uniref:DUF2788 domain-containing protein n=1 Tax=unclassified Ketobacter TaxID=2639109 RepID=UPI0025B93316|nr:MULTISPECIES: DUF2788 domain-containing protein [unclassified Ketobacter]
MNTFLSYTEQEIASFGLSVGLAAFMLYMVFIVAQLARESKAGRFGTFILFLVLTLGMLGFVAKLFIQWLLDI